MNVPIGGSGWNNNAVFVRGSQSFFTGFEYDGVPVNRAFDNYNASTESNLGLQELQVYTGGGPASITSSGTSGFINQVIKTGTYPGFGTLTGGIASGAFYHDLKVEAGGASPDRRFSYYVGLSGYNQDFRFIDNQNGAGLMGQGGIYSDYGEGMNPFAGAFLGAGTPIAGGALPMCDPTTGATPAAALAKQPGYFANGNLNWTAGSCLDAYTGLSGLTSTIADRENVVNFHFAIPRRNGQRDDLQLLWSGSMLKTYYFGSINDLGGLNGFMLAQDGMPYIAPQAGVVGGANPPFNINALYTGNPKGLGCEASLQLDLGYAAAPGTGAAAPGDCNYPFYADAYVWNSHFGQTLTSTSTPQIYYSPDSAAHPTFAQINPNTRDAIYNDQGIVKMQYTHSIGDRAFARLVGYTFYSDWDQTGELAAPASYVFGFPAEALAANYILSTHTTGGEFQFTDQINDKNLLQFTANYTTANVLRDNNSGFAAASYGRGSPTGLITGNATTGWTCYNPKTGALLDPTFGSGGCDQVLKGSYANKYSAQQVAAGTFAIPGAVPGAAGAAGAQYTSLWDSNAKGAYNTVKPQFSNLSFSDQIRPNDKWLLNLGVRYDGYLYGLPNSTTTADQFYGQIVTKFACYNPSTGQALLQPLTAANPPPAIPQLIENPDCNLGIDKLNGLAPGTTKGWAHPNGVASADGTVSPVFSINSPSSYKLNYWSARISGTYTQSPDTVWRFSAGRFVEPPISASTQYLDQSGNFSNNWAGFMNVGFFSPFHAVPAQTSGQYDLSLERHVRGTDLSFKLTPFYNLTNGYQEQDFIGPGFVTQIPVGRFRSYGLEAAITKGDFSKNGLSGSLALTYTNAKTQYQKGLAPNQVDVINNVITNYNKLTKGGGGSLCYPASGGTSTYSSGYTPVSGVCNAADIQNPYYSSAVQSTLDPNGWYAPAGILTSPGFVTSFSFYDAPWVSSLILNYRHDKLAITPSIQFVSGSSYGSPLDVSGLDPTVCQANETTTGLATAGSATANYCDWQTLLQGGSPHGDSYQSGVQYIPNPQTGTFSSIGQFHNPNIITGNLGISYEVSPKVNVNVTLSNIFHTCFGGTKTAWTAAYAPGANICGYGANGLYVSNFQHGAGQATPGNLASYSAAANGTSLYSWQQQSYGPTAGSFASSLPAPFNAYLTVNIKL